MLSLGTYPDVPLKDARERRDESRTLVAKGLNPSQARRKAKLEKSAGSFAAVFEEWFESQRPDWAPSNVKKIRAIAESNILPWIGKRPISELEGEPLEILECLRRVERRGAVEMSHRCNQIIDKVFSLAILTGRARFNPSTSLSDALKKPVTKKRAAITDPKQVGVLIRAIRSYGGSFVVQQALKLSALTFLRPGELRQLRWCDVDLEKAEMSVPVDIRKLKKVQKRDAEPHWVSLSTQAVEVLTELEPLTGHDPQRFLFPNARKARAPMSDGAVLSALRAMGFDKETMSAHGFRSTASTLLNERGLDADVVERQLAHKNKDRVREAYHRANYKKQRIEMMQAWADVLDELALQQDL